MKKFFEPLKKHAMEVIDFKERKMKSLIKEQQKSYQNSKINILKIKKYRIFRDYCHYTGEYRGAAHSICNLKYRVPKEISIVFQNGSNYDYHFIIKDLAEEFEKQFTCLG